MGLTSSSSRSNPCLDLDFSGHSIKQITNPLVSGRWLKLMFICCLERGGWICLGVIREQRRENSYKGKKEKDNFFFLDNALS